MSGEGPHIVVYGDPINGFLFYGPFDSYKEAGDAAKEYLTDGVHWWVAPLDSINE